MMNTSRNSKNVGLGILIALLSSALLLLATSLPSSGFTTLLWVIAFFGFVGATYILGREAVAKREAKS